MNTHDREDAELWKYCLDLFKDERWFRRTVDAAHSKGIALLGTSDHGLRVELVDSSWLMIKHDPRGTFVLGGHDLRYKFIGPKRIWLDCDYAIGKIVYICYHEMIERGLIESGEDKYNKAHDDANSHELPKREEEEPRWGRAA